MKGNFLDVPTDCPQRDERLGWTGDIAAFAPHRRVPVRRRRLPRRTGFVDLPLEQRARPDGIVPVRRARRPEVRRTPGVPPTLDAHRDLGRCGGLGAVSAVAGVRRPQTGSPRTTRRWRCTWRRSQPCCPATGLWDAGFQLGDWLDPDAPPDEPASAKADPGVVATASCYRSAAFAAETARLLGRDAERDEFARPGQHDHGRRSARTTSTTTAPSRRDCATVYALAICSACSTTTNSSAAGDRLAELVARAGLPHQPPGSPAPRSSPGRCRRPATSTTPTGCCCETRCPSWLYPVTMGATTIWERWDSMLPDGTINPGEMTSLQPLRPRRRRRLAAPHRRRPRAARARLPGGCSWRPVPAAA